MDVKTSRFLLCLSAIFYLCKCSLGMAPTNLALNKTTTQSTTLTYGVVFVASRATDGDGATRARTTLTQPSFLYVDLEEEVAVTFILLKLLSPWDNLYVGVGDNPPTGSSVPHTDFGVCQHFTAFPGDWIQTISCGISGRYAIIFNDYPYYLTIAEVEVYNTTEPGYLGIGRIDLASGKASVQSSTVTTSVASKGNDDNPINSARTDPAAPLPAYWFVDLEERFQVTSIILYNGNGWDNLYVGVGDNPPTSASVPGKDFGVCRMFPGNPGDALQNITCCLSGRYVIIFSDVSSDLQIYEVDVYGNPELGQYRQDALFERFENRRDLMRNVNIIEDLMASLRTECANKCVSNEACVSFTYYGSTCRLHCDRAQDYIGGEEQFVAKNGAVYMQVKDEL